MNKFLFKLLNGDIYTFVAGTGWVIIGNGEPTDIMFINSGVTSINNSDFVALLTIANNTDIKILASNQNSVTVELPIDTAIDLGNGSFYKSINIDLATYANVNNIRVEVV